MRKTANGTKHATATSAMRSKTGKQKAFLLFNNTAELLDDQRLITCFLSRTEMKTSIVRKPILIKNGKRQPKNLKISLNSCSFVENKLF